MKEYIPFVSPKSTHIEIHVYYSKGGMNYFNYKQESRGYFVSVTPVKLEGNIMSFEGFSGIKSFLNPCARKSDKQYQLALKQFTPEKKEFLIAQVKAKIESKVSLSAISKELGIDLPPRFEGMTKEEILNLPVHIVDGASNPKYPNLQAAKAYANFNKLCGPFGSDKRDHLRFETQAAYDVLSR